MAQRILLVDDEPRSASACASSCGPRATRSKKRRAVRRRRSCSARRTPTPSSSTIACPTAPRSISCHACAAWMRGAARRPHRSRLHRSRRRGHQAGRRAVPDQARRAAGAAGDPRAHAAAPAERQDPARRDGRCAARRQLDPFLGTSAAIRALAEDAQRIVGADRPVLIQGETGTGKGVLARWLHEHGPRAQEPFVDLNCAGLASELLESELFGHERGAFTGAVASEAGSARARRTAARCSSTRSATWTSRSSRSLLKVLEEKRFRRVGERARPAGRRPPDRARPTRISRARRGTGSFRSDLFYRINTLTLGSRRCATRVEDIPVLARRTCCSA